MTSDQPIYDAAKQIQWHWPNSVGKAKLSWWWEVCILRRQLLNLLCRFLRQVARIVFGWSWASIAWDSRGFCYSIQVWGDKVNEKRQYVATYFYNLLNYVKDGKISEELLSFGDWWDSRKSHSPHVRVLALYAVIEISHSVSNLIIQRGQHQPVLLVTVKPVSNDHLYNKIYYMW